MLFKSSFQVSMQRFSTQIIYRPQEEQKIASKRDFFLSISPSLVISGFSLLQNSQSSTKSPYFLTNSKQSFIPRKLQATLWSRYQVLVRYVTKKILQMITLRLTILPSEVDLLHFHHRIFVMKYRILENFHDIRSRLLRVKLNFLIAEHFAAIRRSWLLCLTLKPLNELLVLLLGLECVEDVGLLAEKAVDRDLGLLTLRLIEAHYLVQQLQLLQYHPYMLWPLIFFLGVVFASFLLIKTGQWSQGCPIFDATYAKTFKMEEKSKEKQF